MGFQAPITVKAALDAIQAQTYVLPAIQREFIWSPDQICALFDSLMQGYPIGAFLFWEVQADRSSDYVWYGFVRDYHERLRPHCPRLDLPNQHLTAILDGQQRLSSLNIGLRGSHSQREKGKRRANLNAYPERRLYVNLLSHAPQNDQGLKYDFRFLTPKRAAERTDAYHWFPVASIYDFKEDLDILETLQDLDLGNHREAGRILSRLFALVHKDTIIPFFVEKSQDLDKVLNIFIRVNSAGTPLSYSDLLLSIATAQWSERDARQEIHDLVDELNTIGSGFSIPQDIVLKAGLLISDIPSIGFRVTNFTTNNMRKLEGNWDAIADAIRLAVSLLSQFGFSSQSLKAGSVILPIAYYLHDRRYGDEYLDSVAYRDDREVMRGWVCRSLLKQGVWGSALDGLLLALRTAFSETVGPFPVIELEAAMAKRGKSLTFSNEEVDDLLDSAYGHNTTFSLLSLMYPFVDVRNHFHIDHIFPRNSLRSSRLSEAGIPFEDWEELKGKVNLLPNLQLLEGPINSSKSDKHPAEWLETAFPDADRRQSHCDLHDIDRPPRGLNAIASYWQQRRLRMEFRLRDVLGLNAPKSLASSLQAKIAEPGGAIRREAQTHDGDSGRPRTTFDMMVATLIAQRDALGAETPGGSAMQAALDALFSSTDANVIPDAHDASFVGPAAHVDDHDPSEQQHSPTQTAELDHGPRLSDGLILYSKPNRAGYNARGLVAPGGFTILKGSTGANTVGTSLAPMQRERREALLADGTISIAGEILTFERDVEFNSPSAAASFIAGTNRSGNRDWITADGIELGSLDS